MVTSVFNPGLLPDLVWIRSDSHSFSVRIVVVSVPLAAFSISAVFTALSILISVLTFVLYFQGILAEDARARRGSKPNLIPRPPGDRGKNWKLIEIMGLLDDKPLYNAIMVSTPNLTHLLSY